MIIGFAGKKGSGKSTAAGFLVELGFVRYSFADPIREMLSSLLSDLGLSADEKLEAMQRKEEVIHPIGVSFRHLAQTLGTEWGRQLVDHDVWIKCQACRLENRWPEARIVYDDIRFENEAALIRAYGGRIVHIRRSGLPEDDHHASEVGIAVADGDLVLDNGGNLGLLLDAVLALVNRYGDGHD